MLRQSIVPCSRPARHNHKLWTDFTPVTINCTYPPTACLDLHLTFTGNCQTRPLASHTINCTDIPTTFLHLKSSVYCEVTNSTTARKSYYKQHGHYDYVFASEVKYLLCSDKLNRMQVMRKHLVYFDYVLATEVNIYCELSNSTSYKTYEKLHGPSLYVLAPKVGILV